MKPHPNLIAPGKNCILSEISTSQPTEGFDKNSAKSQIKKNAKVMADLARRLYASRQRAILLVLQGMDTSGKDGTIRAIMKGMNPQSCQVVSFKAPSQVELDHDYLWRVHAATPRKGNIGIFNRSHYEDVVIVRVHELVAKRIWSQRYEQINAWEQILVENGTVIVKCFLHISKEEQRVRLQDRIDNPDEHWKFNPSDLEERKLWPQYQAAYEDAITKCNTKCAPWHIIPSDVEWNRNLIVSQLLRDKLEELDPQWPAGIEDYRGTVVE
jgi:PPK2 family polyphosphate:nucleotide phosphotransferase